MNIRIFNTMRCFRLSSLAGEPLTASNRRMERVTVRQEEVKSQLETQPADKPLLHPAMASRFHESVKDLANVLNQDDARSEASEHLRGLVYKVVLIPPKGGENDLRIDLCGRSGRYFEYGSSGQKYEEFTYY